MSGDIQAFIHALPKAELHLHLEGSVPWMLTRQYTPEPLPEVPEWWAQDYRFTDFGDFNKTMDAPMLNVLISPERYHQVAAAVFQALVEQNVRYVEISTAVNFIVRQNMNVQEVITAIRAAAPAGLVVCVIGAISRRYLTSLNDPIALAMLETPGIEGIDLQSDERLSGPLPFAALYAAARERGLITRAHAGELLGAEAVRETLDSLGVKRIMHGTNAAQDEALIQRIIDEEVTLDMCPTSNVKLRVVETVAAHPIGALLRRGVRVTCSTDDPAVFGCTLTGELTALVEQQAFTARELAQLQINAFQVAKLTEAQRSALIAEVEAVAANYS